MPKDLLSMDRLPTTEELRAFFKANDWTTMKIDDLATRTPEKAGQNLLLRHYFYSKY